MTDEAQIRALMNDFRSLTEHLSRQRNTLVAIGGSAPVTKASLHLLETVGTHPSERMTDIAQRMDVTKGAVSQLATRLQTEGLLDKRPALGSARDIYLELTPEGQKLYKASTHLNQEVDDEIFNAFSQMRDEDIERLRTMLKRIGQMMESREAEPSSTH